MVYILELLHVDEPVSPAPVDHALASSSQAASRAPSSSRSTLYFKKTLVPLSCVPKSEAQMDTLIHQVKPWMQKSIAEYEARMKKRVEVITD